MTHLTHENYETPSNYRYLTIDVPTQIHRVISDQEIEAEAAAWLEEGAHATDDIGSAAVLF